MPKELPIQWSEVEKAALAGVPMYEIAAKLLETTPTLIEMGYTVKRLYATIRKRASRERWPIPDAIVRRAQAEARSKAAGGAAGAKQGAQWRKGEDGLQRIAESKIAAGMGVPQSLEGVIVEQKSPTAPEGAENGQDGADLGAIGGGVGQIEGRVAAGGGREALPSAPLSAAELVTEDLARVGQRGLRAILTRATEAAESMQAAPDVRSWQDVQTMAKVIQTAAGLDKPATAVQVNINGNANATIETWESLDSA
jgi:hypothetical protein